MKWKCIRILMITLAAMIALTGSVLMAQQDKMVETMLKLRKDLPKAKTPCERESLRRHVAATDKQIDGLAHELHGLTEAEVRIIEDESR